MSLFAATLFSLSALAATPDVPEAAAGLGPGFHVRLDRTIDADPAVVWETFAENFADIASWSEGVTSSRPLDASEVPAGFTPDADAPVVGRFVSSGLGDQEHVLVDYDEPAGTFTFRSAGLPPVMAYAQNTHRIVALPDGKTEVFIDVYIVPKGIARLMRGKISDTFTGYMEAYLDESQAYLEAIPTSDAD